VLRGDARHLPLPDASVDLIVTSPPYFGLRSYTDGGVHYDGQIGSEATPAEWVAALVGCTREWMRVLKPAGSLFVNLGDKYSTGNGGESNLTALGQRLGTGGGQKSDRSKLRQLPVKGMAPKCLLGLPWRYALACTDQLGLILRAEIIWAKPNGLPESVQDRVRRAHEQIFHFTLQPRYYSAVDEIREPHDDKNKPLGPNGRRGRDGLKRPGYVLPEKDGLARRGMMVTEQAYNPLGKLPGSVWSIPSQPLSVPPELGVDHFAAFPMELPRRIITGWSPPGICTQCGQGRRPVADAAYVPIGNRLNNRRVTGLQALGNSGHGRPGGPDSRLGDARKDVTITGYACGCGTWPIDAVQPSTRPSVVLDPFGGTGTTALLAHALGRHGITIDMSADYSRLAQWRTTDRGELARALQVDKPEAPIDGQEPLFSL